jgi:hypothetical protein
MAINFYGSIGQCAGPSHIHATRILWMRLFDQEILFINRQHEFIARTRNLLHKGKLFAEPAMIGVLLNL